MTGKRIASIRKVDPVSVCYWKDADSGEWWLYLPKCGAGRLTNHEVIEHEDGTITVKPSVLMDSGGPERRRHGYLERGVWRDC